MLRVIMNRIEFIPMLVAVVCATAMSTSGAVSGAESERIFIIANKGFPADSLSQSEAKRIFLRQQRAVKGRPVMPINARRTSPLRKQFDQRLLGMTVSEELDFREDQKMQHGLQPPSEIRDTVRAVFSAPSGISYCFESAFKPSAAKILLKI